MEGKGNPDILSLKEGEPSEKNPITIDKEGFAKKEVPHIIKDKRKASEYLQNNSKRKDNGFKDYKSVMCYHWENGTCKKGRFNCSFAHGTSDLKRNNYIPKDRRNIIKDLEDTIERRNSTIYNNNKYIKKLECDNQESNIEYKLKLSRVNRDIKKLQEENKHLKQKLEDKDKIIQDRGKIIQDISRPPPPIQQYQQYKQYQQSYNSPPPLIYDSHN